VIDPTINWAIRDAELGGAGEQVRFLLFFDTIEARDRGLRLMRSVWAYFTPNFELDARLWHTAELDEPTAWEPVFEDIARADLLIMAVDQDNDLRTAIESWLPRQCRANELCDGAVLAIIGDEVDCDRRRVWESLKRFAKDSGFEFQPPEIPGVFSVPQARDHVPQEP
jgi:hypothetical protein